MNPHRIERIALVGDYVPRKCGIATFSQSVREAILSQFPGVECFVVPVTDPPQTYDYPPEVRCEIVEPDRSSYERAADFINSSGAGLVALQHEFFIFGGPAGSHVLALLRRLRRPVVSHLHTVVEDPKPEFRAVLEEIVQRSARVIVMSARGRDLLQRVHQVPPEKIDVIPHGIPDLPLVDPESQRAPLGLAGRRVLLTFGLLVPNKGIEHMIEAMPEIVRAAPAAVYVVLGATHPAVLRADGDAYRAKLERRVAELGLGSHVIFRNQFVDLEELKKYLGATDIYITPYLYRDQVTSGTLAYAFGCGKAVVSTPYFHAEELLADGRGVLVPFADSAALARGVLSLLQDEPRLNAMRIGAYWLGREMVWSQVAHRFMASYRRALLNHSSDSAPQARDNPAA